MCLISRLKHPLLVRQKKTALKLDNSLEIASEEHGSDVSSALWGEKTQNGVRINTFFTQCIAEQFVEFPNLPSWLGYQCPIPVPCSADLYIPCV